MSDLTQKDREAVNVEHISHSSPVNYDLEDKKMATKGIDDALLFSVNNEEITWTAEEERRLLLKIDLRLIPLVS